MKFAMMDRLAPDLRQKIYLILVFTSLIFLFYSAWQVRPVIVEVEAPLGLASYLPARKQKWGLSSLGLLLIHILVRVRRLLFIVADKVLPRPLNGGDLLITGRKEKVGAKSV